MNINEIQPLISLLAEGKHLTFEQAGRAFQIIMNGGATPAQMGAFLVALRIKGETVEELTAAATVLRQKMVTISAPAGTIDTCGTGGDGRHTLNISTAAALVAAACGVPVAKHGNRAVSSRCGSSDVLKELGINIDAPQHVMERCLQESHFCFLLAPRYHPAMRHVAPVRQELQLRTAFNLLGPLINPARVTRQLVGVFDSTWLEPMAAILQALGTSKAWVVHGSDGMDELTLCGYTDVASLEDDGSIHMFRVAPEEFGMETHPLDVLKGGTAKDNATAIETLFYGHAGAYRDAVILNAGAALVVAGKTDHLSDAIIMAGEAIDSGRAKETLAAAVYFSNLTDDAAHD